MKNNLKIIEGLFGELKIVDRKILELTNTVNLFLNKKVKISFELKVKTINDENEKVLTSDGSLRNSHHPEIFDPVLSMLKAMREDIEKELEKNSKPTYTITEDLGEEDMYIVISTIHKNLKKEKERILRRLQLYGVDTEKLTSK